MVSADPISDPTCSIAECAVGNKRETQAGFADERDAVQPSWSPHGYRIAYWGMQREVDSGTSDHSGLVEVNHPGY